MTDKSYVVEIEDELKVFKDLLNTELVLIIEFMSDFLLDIDKESQETITEALHTIKHKTGGGYAMRGMNGDISFTTNPQYLVEEE